MGGAAGRCRERAVDFFGGGSLLAQTARISGLSKALTDGLAPWRAQHDLGKSVLDLAVAIVLGGDCLADLAVVRAQPDLSGHVASDPTISRLIATLAADAPAVLVALRDARATARGQIWRLQPPVATDGPSWSIWTPRSCWRTWRRKAQPRPGSTYGGHPLLAFLDHGTGGMGEPVGGLLRSGKATANDAADHVTVRTQALAQLPAEQRARVPVRGDSGAGVHGFVQHLPEHGLRYSVGFYAHRSIIDALAVVPRQAWCAAIDTHGMPRDGAQVAELARYLRPARNPWPPGCASLPDANARIRAHMWAA